jgi:hypothetical protein
MSIHDIILEYYYLVRNIYTKKIYKIKIFFFENTKLKNLINQKLINHTWKKEWL